MQVQLSATTTQTITPAVVKSFSSITITRMVDLPGQKMVKIFIEELPNPIILWQGEEYDAIGQWSNSDVESALIAKFQA